MMAICCMLMCDFFGIFIWYIAFDIKYFTCVSIFPALLNSIKSRKLDVFFETEEKIMGRATLEKPLLEVSLY